VPYQGASMNHENIQRIIFYILILLLSGCFGTLAKKTMQINLGDDKETVTNAMGSPEDRQFRGTNEAWQYCETDAGISYDDYRIVWFYDGRVSGITSYKNSDKFGACASFFKSIRWEDAPDTTIELRER